jgi:hypothetical protein
MCIQSCFPYIACRDLNCSTVHIGKTRICTINLPGTIEIKSLVLSAGNLCVNIIIKPKKKVFITEQEAAPFEKSLHIFEWPFHKT